MAIKSVFEYINDLPEGKLRQNALRNLLPSARDMKVSTAKEALIFAFNWNNSPEGAQYWINFVFLENGESEHT